MHFEEDGYKFGALVVVCLLLLFATLAVSLSWRDVQIKKEAFRCGYEEAQRKGEAGTYWVIARGSWQTEEW